MQWLNTALNIPKFGCFLCGSLPNDKNRSEPLGDGAFGYKKMWATSI